LQDCESIKELDEKSNDVAKCAEIAAEAAATVAKILPLLV